MNDTMWVAGQIFFGCVLLIWGGELLVRGAASLATLFKISPLVIGLTVVAFGTSAPELGVSVQAAISGNADVAIGNVVGSNIINVLLILGVAAMVTPLIVSSQLIRLDVPLMIGASVCMWVMSADGKIDHWEGTALFAALVVYVVFCIRKSRSEHQAVVDEFSSGYTEPLSGAPLVMTNLGLLVAGLFLLWLGSKWLVLGAVDIATGLGVSELVIGLTIVALGTSLPEVVTSVVASYRGQRDIAVGNVVGSNLFNILCVLGLTSIVSPHGVAVDAEAIEFDIPVMVAVAVICLPIFLTGSVIRRFEGAMFLIYYVVYTTFIVLAATRPDMKDKFGLAIIFAVVPLTLLSLAVSFFQSVGRKNESKAGEPEPDSNPDAAESEA